MSSLGIFQLKINQNYKKIMVCFLHFIDTFFILKDIQLRLNSKLNQQPSFWRFFWQAPPPSCGPVQGWNHHAHFKPPSRPTWTCPQEGKRSQANTEPYPQDPVIGSGCTCDLSGESSVPPLGFRRKDYPFRLGIVNGRNVNSRLSSNLKKSMNQEESKPDIQTKNRNKLLWKMRGRERESDNGVV